MKIFVILSILMCTVNSFTLKNGLDNLVGIPRNICVHEPDGTIFPVVFNCNQFIMCLSGEPTVGRCRSSEPHFHKCFYRCVNDESVCSLNNCDGVTLPPTIAPTVTSPPPTEPPMTQAPTTEPPWTGPTTTTPFRPPTVPGRYMSV
ncbi:uncharacterized protein [Chironomus tepperi]|uniref:uncharacterized protein isoform X2 n=1 Tax=Chironomus tepperi TaxID=113505 RepID=UPI00391F4179